MIANIFIWIAGIIGGLLVLLLFFPFRIRLQGWADVPDHAAFHFAVTWGWGLMGIEKQAGGPLHLRLFGFPAGRLSLPGTKKEKKKKTKPKSKKTSRSARMATVGHHFDTMLRVIGRLVKATFPRGRVTGRIGLSDPADTATIALFSRFFNPSWEYFQVIVIPSYEAEVVQIDTEAKATVVIGYLGLTALLLLLQKQTREMLYSLRHA